MKKTRSEKILLLIDSLCSGGAQRQFVGLAVMLKSAGYDVLAAGYHDDLFYLPYLREHGVEYRYVKEAKPTKTRIWKMHRFIMNYDPDVVISYLDTPCILACLSKLMGGKFRLVVSERNTTQRLTWAGRIKFFLYRWADVIVPNSFSQARFIEQHYPHLSSKVMVITNHIEVGKFVPKSHEEKSPLRIVSVGRVNRQKNIPVYLKALSEVRRRGCKVQVDWYGRSDDEAAYEESVETLKVLQLEDVFHFYGETSNVVDVYNEADIFCLPSLYEGFPNVLCEAMCCGKPVVCSRVCDNPDIVKGGENGYLFDPRNVKEMADAIERMLLLNETERSAMGRRNHERIAELCSSESFIQKYIEVL